MELKIPRDIFTQNTTGGKLYSLRGGNWFYHCYTLEDARRAPGIKVYGHTCLPPGRYKLIVTESTRFGREMVMIYNCANKYETKAEGISYKGLRMHGLNTHENTLGCIGVAYNRIDNDTIQGTAEKEITKLVKAAIDRGEEAWLQIEDVI